MASVDLKTEPDVIRNTGQRTNILRRLHETRTLLDIHLPGRGAPFRSALLYVDSQHHLLNLDELHPRRGHERVEVGMPLRVVSRAGGVDTRFNVTVQDIAVADAIHYYVTGFPDEILYHQRRRFVRVPVPLTRQRHCVLTDDDDQETRIELSDLSAGGIGAYVRKDFEVESRAVYTAHLDIHGADPLISRVEIRFAEFDRQRKRQRFGAEFLDFTAADRDRLQALVLSLQRELLRKT